MLNIKVHVHVVKNPFTISMDKCWLPIVMPSFSRNVAFVFIQPLVLSESSMFFEMFTVWAYTVIETHWVCSRDLFTVTSVICDLTFKSTFVAITSAVPFNISILQSRKPFSFSWEICWYNNIIYIILNIN